MSKPRVCYDAGHYGNYNTSPANKAYNEAKRMWEHHLLVKKYTEQLGVEVITTRDEQEKDLALSARGKKGAGCNASISFHSNAVDSKVHDDIDYVVAYVMCNDKQISCDDDARVLAQKLVDVTAEVMGTSQKPRITERLSENDKDHDGIKDDNYYGFLAGARTVEVPALILENSFHTNTRMTNWLLDDANLDKLARRQAEVIASHVLGREVKLTDTSTPVSTPTKPATSTTTSKKSNEEIASEVIAGKWGNGDDRKAKLQAAGYDYSTIQKIVNAKLSGKPVASTPASKPTPAPTPKPVAPAPTKKSVDEIASEVIAGKWGNGADREAKLKSAGYNYSEVQAAVNKKLGVKTSTPASKPTPAPTPKPVAPAKKSNDEIAKEVIAGKWGNGDTRKQKLASAGYDYSAIQKIVNKLLK